MKDGVFERVAPVVDFPAAEARVRYGDKLRVLRPRRGRALTLGAADFA